MKPATGPGLTLQYFRSIIVPGKIRHMIPAGPFAAELSEWLKRFSEFQKRELGFDRGNNLHLLTGRNLLFLGEDILLATSTITSLAQTGNALGYATTIRIRLKDALDNVLAFDDLLRPESAISSIILDSQGRPPDDSPTIIEPIVNRLLSAGKNLSLMGSVSYWLGSGILDGQEINGHGFSISAIPTASASAPAVKSADPCASRFQLFISEAGDVFPCQGLMGIPSCRLGNISLRADDPVFSDDWGNFAHWAKNGPARETGLAEPTATPPLPMICRLHQSQIQQTRAHP